MNIVPVRFRDRWIDDGSKIELWNEDHDLGLRLDVASTSKAEPLAAMEIRRIGQVPVTDLASLIVDLANGEIRFHASPGGVLDPPLDLDWLRGTLDDELRAARRCASASSVGRGPPICTIGKTVTGFASGSANGRRSRRCFRPRGISW